MIFRNSAKLLSSCLKAKNIYIFLEGRRRSFDPWVREVLLGGGNGNPLQYSYLGNPMDKGACWAPVHRVAEVQTQLSD